MDERAGCELLKQRFTAAGLTIVEHYALREPGLEVTLDGYDPKARVGYEYITTAAGDRAEITPEVVAALESRMRAGDLFVLLLDEQEEPTPERMERAADHFLSVLRARGHIGTGTP